MTLDQVPTEERTALLNLSQVPLKMGRGFVSFSVYSFQNLMPEPYTTESLHLGDLFSHKI